MPPQQDGQVSLPVLGRPMADELNKLFKEDD